MNIFVVVPVFNEEKRVGGVIKNLKKTGLMVVLVDDGSTDDSWRVLQSFKRKNSRLTLLKHKINLGKGAAMETGAEASFMLGADAVIFMDGDGQHSVSDIYKFLSKLKDNDVVFGERKQRGNMRLYLAKIASFLTKLLYGIETSDLLCGFRAISKKAYKYIKWDSPGYGVETEMVIRTGLNKLKFAIVPVKTVYFDIFKGFTIIDGFRILFNIVRWRLTI